MWVVTHVGVHEAKTNLSKLLLRVAAGEEITITRGGKQVAKLVPVGPPVIRSLGVDRGVFTVPDDFNHLPDDIQADFE